MAVRVLCSSIILAAFTALSHGEGKVGVSTVPPPSPANQAPVLDVFGEIQEVAGDVPLIQGPLRPASTKGNPPTNHGQLKRIVKANAALILDGSARLRLSLTSTQTVTASKNLKEKVGDFEVWQGITEGGSAEERVSMVAGPNGTTYGKAIVKSPQGDFTILEILPMQSDPTRSTVSEVPLAQFPDGNPIEIPNAPSARASRRRRQTTGDSGGTIDVMVLYTPAVTNYYGLAGIQAKVVSAVADANTALYNSQVPVRFNLVYMAQVDYTEKGDMMSTLSQLQSTTDGVLDGVHALRDKYNADLVQLLTSDVQYCGLGYMLSASSVGRPDWANGWGFSVVAHLCMNGLTPAHEWGHNLGLQHNKEDAGDSSFPYAYGYRICGPGGIQTVMAYYCNQTVRVPYYSNPRVSTTKGQITGVANVAENARALAQTAWTVANYRVAGVVRTPPIPTYVSATAPFGKRVDLKWQDVPDETGFRVYRMAQSETSFTLVATVPINTLTYADTTVSPVTTYTYRIAAFNSAGQSQQSIPVTILTPATLTDPTIDEIPTITVTPNADQSAVVVCINPLKTTDPTTFTIERSTNSATAVTIGTTTTAGNFTDSTTTPGALYAYDVVAVGPTKNLRRSTVKTVAIPLKPPGGLNIAVQGTTITLTWAAVSGATQYLVTRKPISGQGLTINPSSVQFTISAPATTHVSTGVSYSTVYQYTVQALSTVSPLVTSTTTTTTAQTGVGPLLAPTQITCVASSAAAVKVSWGASWGATGYTVQLVNAITSPLQGPLTDYPSTTTSIIWTPLEPSTTYRFVVYAKNSTATSPASAMCTVTTSNLLGSVLSYTTNANNQIGLKWSAVIGASGYTIRRSTPLVAGSTPIVINIAAPTVSYADTRAVAGNRRYDYTITPYYSRGFGPVSSVLSIITPPLNPAVSLVLSSQSKGTTTAIINWTIAAGVSTTNLRFRVYRKASNQTSSTLVAALTGTARSFTQTGLQRGLTYTYWVYYDNVYGVSSGAAVAFAV